MAADVVSLNHDAPRRREIPEGKPPFDPRKVCAAYFRTLVEQTGLSAKEYAQAFSEALDTPVTTGMVQRWMDGRGPCFPADYGVVAKWLAGPDPDPLELGAT